MLFLVFILFAFPAFGDLCKEFYDLNGKNSVYWHWVQTPQDLSLVQRCAQSYSQRHPRYLSPMKEGIPETIHMIWLGPAPFPSAMLGVLHSWRDHHPHWNFYLWTDRSREGLPEFISLRFVCDFQFISLGECFQAATNWAEKSDILRYEVIYQEGGVYVDHDAFCLKSFIDLHQRYRFYCALAMPHPKTYGSSAITIGNGLFGSVPGHSVLEYLLFKKKLQILNIMTNYAGDTVNRVMKGSYGAFSSSVLELFEEGVLGPRDIIFPAAYFWGRDGMPLLYSIHFFQGSWL